MTLLLSRHERVWYVPGRYLYFSLFHTLLVLLSLGLLSLLTMELTVTLQFFFLRLAESKAK